MTTYIPWCRHLVENLWSQLYRAQTGFDRFFFPTLLCLPLNLFPIHIYHNMGDDEQAQAQAVPMPQPGQQPTPEQIEAMQRQIAAEAEKHGLSVPEYIARVREQAMMQHQAQLRAQQQMQQQQAQQQQPIQPGPPKPEALAVANWLKSQELKPRTVINDEKRKEMFKGTVAHSLVNEPTG